MGNCMNDREVHREPPKVNKKPKNNKAGKQNSLQHTTTSLEDNVKYYRRQEKEKDKPHRYSNY